MAAVELLAEPQETGEPARADLAAPAALEEQAGPAVREEPAPHQIPTIQRIQPVQAARRRMLWQQLA
jgi:hypothetical protein